MDNNEDYFDNYLLMEQPYYRIGMSKEEGIEEQEYLNNNLETFFNGDYRPLWKQKFNKNA